MPRAHKTLPRLFVEADLAPGQTLALGKEQANYLANVLRRGAGDRLVLFNGRDGAFLAEITTASRKAVELSLIEQTAPQTAPADLIYLFAPLKSARLDYMVQKATEMGVSALHPVLTDHTQSSRINLERMRANAIEAAEQCEVLSVPAIRPEIKLLALLADWERKEPGRLLIMADESAPAGSPLDQLAPHRGRPLALLIGPEGGFSDAERQKLLGLPFVLPVSLGPRILRADTAAVAALAVIQSIIGDWR